jgi:hypothetical protein
MIQYLLKMLSAKFNLPFFIKTKFHESPFSVRPDRFFRRM